MCPVPMQKLGMPEAEVYFCPHFFTPQQATYYDQRLHQHIAWRQDTITMFGKKLLLPRLTAWYADAGKIYKYSGIKNTPLPWTPDLLQIKEAIEKETGLLFNSVLLNYYRHGQDSMGWHSDDEPELGPSPDIASVSFGQERRFDFRHKTNKAIPKQSVLLTTGSLLLMKGATQKAWQHQVAKSRKALGPRINLTFRFIF